MGKSRKNRGFSLVELIVTIAVITVLSGTLIPQFVKYTYSRRQQACRANREALLNIYEKAVYDDQLLIKQEDLQMILDASGSKMTTEYTNQASDYLICPEAKEAGHFTAHVNADMTVYVTCDEHPDDVCTLSFDNWVAKAELVIDEDPVIPVPGGGPVDPDGSSDPEEEEEIPPVDTTETVNTGIWPRPMDSQGRVDERWAEAGLRAGSTVTINSPVHFIDTTGAEIVIVTGPKYTVKFEDAAYPLGKGAKPLPGVIAASGIKYNSDKMPVRMDVQEDSRYEYKTHYDTVEYKGVTETVTRYKYCEYVDCPNRYKMQHTHPETGWGQSWSDWWNPSRDCGVEGCPLRNKDMGWSDQHRHGDGTSSLGYYNKPIEIKEDVYRGPDCGFKDCPDRYKKDHSHQVENGVDKFEIKGDIHHDVYRVNYGDMLELNGVTYICVVNSGEENYLSELPKAGETALGVNYNGWYVVPALTK